MLRRYLSRRAPGPSARRQLVAVTGPPHAGKTTLAKELYPDLRYLDLEAEQEHNRLRDLGAEEWTQAVGPAVLDELQKLPELADKVRWAWDEGELDFSVLLGSFRILSIEPIREALAGQVFLYELWPLTVAELAPFYGGPTEDVPLVARMIRTPEGVRDLLAPYEAGMVGTRAEAAQAALLHLLEWGGLPALLDCPLGERIPWIESCQSTYLDDLSDIVRVRNRKAFSTIRRLAAAGAGDVFSYSALARKIGVPVTTVRLYVEYLELSYQSMLLPAYSGPRLAKLPKLLWLDSGVQRAVSGQTAGLADHQYENAVICQILFTLWNLGLRVRACFLKTHSNLEVDLVLEPEGHLLAFEVKAQERVSREDAAPIEEARSVFGERYRAGIIVYRGQRVEQLTETVYAVPDWILLGY
ncbi:MAG: ATP-binding protein [bacterium]|nr:ATP-binding protein [bacterium]